MNVSQSTMEISTASEMTSKVTQRNICEVSLLELCKEGSREAIDHLPEDSKERMYLSQLPIIHSDDPAVSSEQKQRMVSYLANRLQEMKKVTPSNPPPKFEPQGSAIFNTNLAFDCSSGMINDDNFVGDTMVCHESDGSFKIFNSGQATLIKSREQYDWYTW